MENNCVCCKKRSRILISKKECELQTIFYFKLPTEIIRTIGEYLYQSQLIQINYKVKNKIENIPEHKTLFNCSSCFLYNFIIYKELNPNKMPRLRNDINWFNKLINTSNRRNKFVFYYDDLDKFIFPSIYEMCFYRSSNVITIKHNVHLEKTQTENIFNNKNIKHIIIPTK